MSFYFFRPWKCQKLAQKVGKTHNSNSKSGKNLKFVNLMFTNSLFNMSFTKYINLYLCHIYMINKNTDLKSNWSWISLLLPVINLKIHGILCHQRSGNLDLCNIQAMSDLYRLTGWWYALVSYYHGNSIVNIAGFEAVI